MSSSKSKNIIIIVLLLLNAILFAIVIFDKTEAASAKEAEIDALIDVLKANAISLDDELDFDIDAPLPCSIVRNEIRDNKLMEKLIGYSYREDMGGNVIFYRSDMGEAMLHGTGVISLLFHDDQPDLSGDFAQSAAKYMSRKGIDLYPENAEANIMNDSATVNVPCAYDGNCIYNAKLSFTISDGRLIMIDGTRVFDGEITQKNVEIIDSVSAIMYFLDYVRNDGYICSSINGLEAGYFMNVAVSGESSLRPVWRISTDTGVVYINAVSGKTESLPA